MQHRKITTLNTKRGFAINAFEQDSITREIQGKGEYDANTLNSLSEVLGVIKPNLALDVGANIGNHGLVISSLVKQLIAFEPVSFVFNVLQKNMAQNNISNVDVQNYALSNTQQTVEIFIPDNGNLGSSSLEAKHGDGEAMQINTLVGDAFLQTHYAGQTVDFIKMDVEGHEAEAILGLKHTILQSQPLMLLEWKSAHTKSRFEEEKLFQQVFAGYAFYALTYTANKKVYARTIAGYLKRLFKSISGSQWCLSGFQVPKDYANVYFVPPRYQAAFKQFVYLDALSQ